MSDKSESITRYCEDCRFYWYDFFGYPKPQTRPGWGQCRRPMNGHMAGIPGIYSMDERKLISRCGPGGKYWELKPPAPPPPPSLWDRAKRLMTKHTSKITQADELQRAADAAAKVLNGGKSESDPKTGFVLLIFPLDNKDRKICDFISNADDKEDVYAMMERFTKNRNDENQKD